MKHKRILRGSKYAIYDSHVHVCDFLQNIGDLRNLIRQMDKANVYKAVILGMPVRKIFQEEDRTPPKYYADNTSKVMYTQETDILIAEGLRKLDPRLRKRLIPLACGCNPMDRNCVQVLERTFNRYKGLFKGVGEILLRHDDLTSMTLGQTPRANSRGMMAVADFCRRKEVPLLIHQNVTSRGFEHHPEYIHELKDLLNQNPNTLIVWAHCGVSRRVSLPNLPRLVRNMLSYYPNLYLDYSWVLVHEMLHTQDGSPRQEWVDLTEDFSDRIVLGSDLVLRHELIGHTLRAFDGFLDVLKPNTRTNLCKKNFERIYG